MKLLFVCTGNTCRSPMAEALAQKILSEKGFQGECSSAGIYAIPEQKTAENAVKILAEYGIEDFSHTAKPITKKMIDENDLIIAMTENHRILLCQKFGASDKICTLGENIGDPFGGDLETYRKCAESIYREILALCEKGIIYG